MFYRFVFFCWTFLLDLAAISRLTTNEKDLEIMVLRQQLRIVERRQQRGLQIPRWQKVPLMALVMRLKAQSRNTREQLANTLLLFKPETVLGWHRDLVRRKWTFQAQRRTGRPSIGRDLESWIVRLAQDNPGLGFDKLEGELRKLGFVVSASTIRTVLRKHGIPPAPERNRKSSSWRTFLNHYRQQLLACDFFTIETVWLKTVYVLFFIELSTRRVYFAGCTTQPTSAWVTQQARQLTWQLESREPSIRFLIHDRDTKFTRSFDTVFTAQGVEIILTPYRAPNANAVAERWIRTVREECLDRLLIWNEQHLKHMLVEYIRYYNERRPHQGLHQHSPLVRDMPVANAPIRYRTILGGIIRDYYREAA
jgi:putative transposase